MKKYKKYFPENKRYKGFFNNKVQFSEELKLSDLMNNKGISSFTKKFRKERNKLLGSESKVAKLTDIDINKNKDYVDFIFITKTTPKYPKGYDYKKAVPPNYKLKPNPTRMYKITIRFLNFFEWLDTTPGEIENITKKDIEDVLEVASIQIADTTPSFNWQGGAYWASQLGAGIFTQDIYPDFWDDKTDSILSKNAQGIINNIKFFSKQMTQMLRAKLGLTKK